MTIQLESGNGWFSLNGTQYPVGGYRVVIHGDNIGLSEVGSSGYVDAANPEFYGNWDDETGTPYATKEELLNDLEAKIFVSGNASSSEVIGDTTLPSGNQNVAITIADITLSMYPTPTSGTTINIFNDSGGDAIIDGNGKNIWDETTFTMVNKESLTLVFLNDKWYF